MRRLLALRTYIDLTLAVVITAGLVFTLGFGVCLYIAQTEVTKEVKNKVENAFEYVDSFVDGNLLRVEDVAYTFLSDEFGASNRDADGEALVLVDPATFRLPTEEEWFGKLERFLDINPHICGIAIGFETFVTPNTKDEYGFAAYVTNVTGTKERLALGQIHDFHQKEWYKEAASRNHSYWSRPFRETRMGKVVTCYSIPLLGVGGRLIGVLALDIDTEAFRRKCDEFSPFEGSMVAIIDRELRFVSHTDSTNILKAVSELDEYNYLLVDSLISQTFIEDEGKNYAAVNMDNKDAFFFVSSALERNGWTICIECPKSEVYGGVKQMKYYTTIIAVVSILIMLLAMLWIFRRLQNATIAQASIESELKVASSIQMGLVPKAYPAFPDRQDLDVCGFLKPARTVGGDLYDYFISNEKLYFCIGDVSGKGVPASLFMTSVVALFRNNCIHSDDPADILSSINDTLSRGNEHCMFCTIFIGVLNLASGELHYCNGGHNAPVLFDHAPDHRSNIHYMDIERNLPVGVIQGFPYQSNTHQLKPGEALFLYTDGITEAEDAEHHLLGEEATLSILAKARKAHDRSAKGLVDQVYIAITDYARNVEQSDDITMLYIEYKNNNI